jgi:ABC-type phosphate/phosphonate transport system ATPase subunit
LDTLGATGESNPAKASRLIQNVDAVDKQIDRKNLSADDSERDILAQKLLQEAKKALADRDSVAAMSLATKASTLFAPLPKLAVSSLAPAP